MSCRGFDPAKTSLFPKTPPSTGGRGRGVLPLLFAVRLLSGPHAGAMPALRLEAALPPCLLLANLPFQPSAFNSSFSMH